MRTQTISAKLAQLSSVTNFGFRPVSASDAKAAITQLRTLQGDLRRTHGKLGATAVEHHLDALLSIFQVINIPPRRHLRALTIAPALRNSNREPVAGMSANKEVENISFVLLERLLEQFPQMRTEKTPDQTTKRSKKGPGP